VRKARIASADRIGGKPAPGHRLDERGPQHPCPPRRRCPPHATRQTLETGVPRSRRWIRRLSTGCAIPRRVKARPECSASAMATKGWISLGSMPPDGDPVSDAQPF
jgi:hypothetical protein